MIGYSNNFKHNISYSSPCHRALDQYEKSTKKDLDFAVLLKTLDSIFAFQVEQNEPIVSTKAKEQEANIENYYYRYYFDSRNELEKSLHTSKSDAIDIFLKQMDRIVKFGAYSPITLSNVYENSITKNESKKPLITTPPQHGQSWNYSGLDLRNVNLVSNTFINQLNPSTKFTVDLQGADLRGVTLTKFDSKRTAKLDYELGEADLRYLKAENFNPMNPPNCKGALLKAEAFIHNIPGLDLSHLPNFIEEKASGLLFSRMQHLALDPKSLNNFLKHHGIDLNKDFNTEHYIYKTINSGNTEKIKELSRAIVSINYGVSNIAKEYGVDENIRNDIFKQLISGLESSNISQIEQKIGKLEFSDYEFIRDKTEEVLQALIYPELIANLNTESLQMINEDDLMRELMPRFYKAILQKGVRFDQLRELSELWYKSKVRNNLIEVNFSERSTWHGLLDENQHPQQRIKSSETFPYDLQCLLSTNDFKRESKETGNCLYRERKYTSGAVNGEYHFFSIRDSDDKPLRTMAFRLLQPNTEKTPWHNQCPRINIPNSDLKLELCIFQDDTHDDLISNAFDELKTRIESGDIQLQLENLGYLEQDKKSIFDRKISDIEKAVGLHSKSIQIIDKARSNLNHRQALAQENAWIIIARPRHNLIGVHSEDIDTAGSRSRLNQREEQLIKTPALRPAGSGIEQGGSLQREQFFSFAKGPGDICLNDGSVTFIPKEFKEQGLDQFMESSGLRYKMWQAVDTMLHPQ